MVTVKVYGAQIRCIDRFKNEELGDWFRVYVVSDSAEVQLFLREVELGALVAGISKISKAEV